MTSTSPNFIHSFSVFDQQGRLEEWNHGFVIEFSDAEHLLTSGTPASEICDACLLPLRALDLSWAADTPPSTLCYINNRHSIFVSQEKGCNGRLLRFARIGHGTLSVHEDLSPEATQQIISGLLRMSNAIRERRHREEEELRASQAALIAANKRLSSALQFNETILLNSPLPMGVYAEDGQCVGANEAYASLVGATREALLAQNFHQIKAWQISGFLDDCVQALENQQQHRREIHVMSTFGKEVIVECRIFPTGINDRRHLLIQFIDLTDQKRREDELRQYAFHDALTRLPNRRLLLDRMKHAIQVSKRYRSYFAVLFLDLNHFKMLNDTHGHQAGDQLLIQVSLRLRKTVRKSDTVARFGGDEFVILMEGLGSTPTLARHYAQSVAEKIRAELSKNHEINDVQHAISTSIGIRLANGTDEDPDIILKEADHAMYEDKRLRNA